MTPKEKANEIYKKFFRITPQPFLEKQVKNLKFHDWDKNWTHQYAKNSSIIAVEELIYAFSQFAIDNQFYYWQEVKSEIEKL